MSYQSFQGGTSPKSLVSARRSSGAGSSAGSRLYSLQEGGSTEKSLKREVVSLRREVTDLKDANASLESRLAALEASNRLTNKPGASSSGGLQGVPCGSLLRVLTELARAEAHLKCEHTITKQVRGCGLTKTLGKKPGQNAASLLTESLIRAAVCISEQTIVSTKVAVKVESAQLQMAAESKVLKQKLAQLAKQQKATFNALGKDGRDVIVSSMLNDTSTDPDFAALEQHQADLAAQHSLSHHTPTRGDESVDELISRGTVILEQRATKIQAVFRGRKGREEVAASVALMAEEGGYGGGYQGVSSRTSPEEMELLSPRELTDAIDYEAASRVQAMQRGRQARQQRAAAAESAAKIQTVFRGHKVRRDMDEGNFENLGLNDYSEDDEDSEGGIG